MIHSLLVLWDRLRTSALGRVALAKLVADVAARLAVFVVVAMILRDGGADDLGAWSQLQVLAAFSAPLVVVGVVPAIVPHFAGRPWTEVVRHRARTVFALAGVGSAAATGVLLLAAPVVDDLILDWPRGHELFRWGSLLIGLAGMELLSLTLLQARRRLGTYVALQMATTVGTLTAAAVVLPGGGDIVRLVQVTVVWRAALVAVAVVLALTAREVADDETVADDVPPVPVLIRFGATVALAEIGAWVVQLGDRLVVGHFRSARDLGVYAAVYTACGAISIVGAAILLPAYPRLSAAWAAGRHAALEPTIRTFHEPLVTVVVPTAFLLIAGFDRALLTIGEGDTRAGVAVSALVIGAIAISQWNCFAHRSLVVIEGGRAVGRAWLAGAVVAVASSLALVPAFGLVGAGGSTILGYGTAEGLLAHRLSRWVSVRRAYALDLTVRALAASTVALVPFVLLLEALPDGIVGLVAASAAFVVAYVGLLVALARRRPPRHEVPPVGERPEGS